MAMRQLAVWVGCYILWTVYSGIGLLLFWLLRGNVLEVARASTSDAFVVGLADRVGTIVLGLLWLIGVMALEAYLRNGVHKGQFPARAIRTAVVIGCIIAVSLFIRWTVPTVGT